MVPHPCCDIDSVRAPCRVYRFPFIQKNETFAHSYFAQADVAKTDTGWLKSVPSGLDVVNVRLPLFPNFTTQRLGKFSCNSHVNNNNLFSLILPLFFCSCSDFTTADSHFAAAVIRLLQAEACFAIWHLHFILNWLLQSWNVDTNAVCLTTRLKMRDYLRDSWSETRLVQITVSMRCVWV